MNALKTLLLVVLFFAAIAGVLMALAYLPINRSFLPPWAEEIVSIFPPLDSAGSVGTIIGVVVVIVGSALGVGALDFKSRQVRR